jgi:hypothetical protein
MVVEVNLAVLQPHRMMQSPRHIDKLVAQRIQPMQPAEQRVAENIEVELAVVLGNVDDGDLQRVRVQIRRLAVEQHCVHAVEPLHSTIIAMSGYLRRTNFWFAGRAR